MNVENKTIHKCLKCILRVQYIINNRRLDDEGDLSSLLYYNNWDSYISMISEGLYKNQTTEGSVAGISHLLESPHRPQYGGITKSNIMQEQKILILNEGRYLTYKEYEKFESIINKYQRKLSKLNESGKLIQLLKEYWKVLWSYKRKDFIDFNYWELFTLFKEILRTVNQTNFSYSENVMIERIYRHFFESESEIMLWEDSASLLQTLLNYRKNIVEYSYEFYDPDNSVIILYYDLIQQVSEYLIKMGDEFQESRKEFERLKTKEIENGTTNNARALLNIIETVSLTYGETIMKNSNKKNVQKIKINEAGNVGITKKGNVSIIKNVNSIDKCLNLLASDEFESNRKYEVLRTIDKKIEGLSYDEQKDILTEGLAKIKKPMRATIYKTLNKLIEIGLDIEVSIAGSIIYEYLKKLNQ